jgi:leader peptidase (prepilin peptidase) / N-methyltransferase
MDGSFTAFWAVIAGLLGAAFGSFGNVVVHRIPRGQSLARPPSSCPSCGTKIRSIDNIPIVSYVLLRGRCRNCGASISPRYAIVEAAAAGLAVASVLRFGAGERAAFAASISIVLLVLAAIDLEHRRLPNVIVLPATAAAALWVVLRAAFAGEWGSAAEAFLCGAAAFALLFLIAVVSRGMGFGDVKLAGFIGLATGSFGWRVAVLAIFASFFLGGFAAVALLLLGKKGRKAAIPFGPALAAGGILAVFAGEGPVRTWLGG